MRSLPPPRGPFTIRLTSPPNVNDQSQHAGPSSAERGAMNQQSINKNRLPSSARHWGAD